MPSKISQRILKQIMLLKPILRSMDIDTARKSQDAIGALGARVLKNRIVYSAEVFENFDAEWALPIEEDVRDGVILYLHGGSYTAGSLAYAKGFGGVIAERFKRIVLCTAYRLAPEFPFPAALEDAVEAYLRILEKYPSQKIAIVGESAGGGLSFALAQRLKQIDVPAPACIVALSPWADLTCSGGSHIANAEKDPSLFIDSLRTSASYYAGVDTKHPLVSPVFADHSDMPPAIIYVGTLEIILDDSIKIAELYDKGGSSCELHIADDMWHVYVLFKIPEADEALTRIEEFIDEHCLQL